MKQLKQLSYTGDDVSNSFLDLKILPKLLNQITLEHTDHLNVDLAEINTVVINNLFNAGYDTDNIKILKCKNIIFENFYDEDSIEETLKEILKNNYIFEKKVDGSLYFTKRD